MILTADERFEVKAEAFRQMTGHVAPGKDCRTTDPEVRRAAWEVWNIAYGPAVNAAIGALASVLPDSASNVARQENDHG